MTKELQKRPKGNSSLTPFREIQATGRTLSEFKPVTPKTPEFYHPFGYDEPKGMIVGITFLCTAGISGISLALLGALFGMSMNGFWITSSALSTVTTSLMSFLAFADGNPDAKIRNFFTKIFFTKKQRRKLSQSYVEKIQYMKNTKEYHDAWEAYQILVQQEIEKLKEKGVFEKQRMSSDGTYWHINDYGEVGIIGKSQYHEKYMGKQLTNTNLKQDIIAKIVDNYNKTQKAIE